MNIEETLNGGYSGLYGEVVTEDTYHIRDLEDIVSINDPTFVHRPGHKRAFDFTPDVILDLGANIGIFSRYARSLFPDAIIIAVEPDHANCELFMKFTPASDRIFLLNEAIGKGKIWHFPGAVNGSGETYLSEGSAFTREALNQSGGRVVDVGAVMPEHLIPWYTKPDQKLLIKIDIEGAENVIFDSPISMKALLRADYLCMEVHPYALIDVDAVKALIEKSLKYFEATHICKRNENHFYATKR